MDYESTARVLLMGTGADELLGGYSRHREAFKRGWSGLVEEIQLDIDRIPHRNLGRDDRMIGDHGKETRLPFLAENVVSYLASVPIYLKCDPRCKRGIGEKLLLRIVAKKLGLGGVATKEKRAIQFGSKSARLDEALSASEENQGGSQNKLVGTDKVYIYAQ